MLRPFLDLDAWIFPAPKAFGVVSSENSASQPNHLHPPGRFPIGFLDPFDNARRVGRIFELDRDNAVHPEFLDRLQVRSELHDAAAGRQISMYLAVTITQMNVDGFALQFLNLLRPGVRQYQVAYVNVRTHTRMVALVHETDHCVHAVQKAQAKWFQLEGDVDSFFVRVIP